MPRGETPAKAVLFDVDGVLINSDEALHKVFAITLQEFGFEPKKHEQILASAGFDDLSWIKSMLPPSQRRNKKLIKEMAEHTSRLYGMTGIPKWVKEISGASNALKQIALKKAVITNMRRHELETVLKTFGWKKRFKTKVCFEDVKKRKPDPEPLLLASKKLGLRPSECLYVGDTIVDVKAARAAGMNCVLLSHARNKKVSADYRIKSMKSLPGLVTRLSRLQLVH